MDIPNPSLTSFATRILAFKFSSFWHVVVACACGVVSAVGPGDLCSAISSTKIAKHLNPNFDECPVLCSNFLRCALQTAGIIINGLPKNKHRNSTHTHISSSRKCPEGSWTKVRTLVSKSFSVKHVVMMKTWPMAAGGGSASNIRACS